MNKIATTPMWKAISNSSFQALIDAKKISQYNTIGQNKPKTLEVK